MHRTIFLFIAVIERSLRLFGLDVYTELDRSYLGPFDFRRVSHGKTDVEYWGLGLHVTASSLERR